jgi:hypothetical protein
MVFLIQKQPHVIISYVRVGRLLYWSLILFILEAWFYGLKLQAAIIESSFPWIVFWFVFFLFSFSHIFLVMMDGWSRFQNYKRAKDQFYIHGFNKRIADTYIGSKCQRMAATVAAEELGIGDTVKAYYIKKRIKWYHFVPFFMIRDPFFLFRKKFWSRTFLEKNYTPKFDYHELQLKLKA